MGGGDCLPRGPIDFTPRFGLLIVHWLSSFRGCCRNVGNGYKLFLYLVQHSTFIMYNPV